MFWDDSDEELYLHFRGIELTTYYIQSFQQKCGNHYTIELHYYYPSQ